MTRDLGLPNLGAVFLGCEGEGVVSLEPGVGPSRKKLSDNLLRHLLILLSLEKLLALEAGEEWAGGVGIPTFICVYQKPPNI